MENQQTSTKSIILNYGLILGIITILFSVIMYAMQGVNLKPPLWQTIIGYFISIGVIYMAIKKFKEINNHTLSIGQAIKTGVGIALIAGIIIAIFTFIFTKFVEPNFQTMILEHAQETMLESNPDLSDEQVEASLKITKMFTSPTIMLPLIIVGKIITGLIVSLIVGLIMKKDESYT